jgi:hypothetical protein
MAMRGAAAPLYIGRHGDSGQPRVLSQNIQFDIWSGRGQLVYLSFGNRALITAHRVAERARSEHLKPGTALIVHNQPLVNGSWRRGSPSHGDNGCHLLPDVHSELNLPGHLPELGIKRVDHSLELIGPYGRCIRRSHQALRTVRHVLVGR